MGSPSGSRDESGISIEGEGGGTTESEAEAVTGNGSGALARRADNLDEVEFAAAFGSIGWVDGVVDFEQ